MLESKLLVRKSSSSTEFFSIPFGMLDAGGGGFDAGSNGGILPEDLFES